VDKIVKKVWVSGVLQQVQLFQIGRIVLGINAVILQ